MKEADTEFKNNYYNNQEHFYQQLVFYSDSNTKEAVIDGIHILEKDPKVLMAEPSTKRFRKHNYGYRQSVGDINDDTRVTQEDVTMLLKYLVERIELCQPEIELPKMTDLETVTCYLDVVQLDEYAAELTHREAVRFRL